MPRYLALLRAINVGGHTVKMERLRQLFESLGFERVSTFIASGNVLFEAGEEDALALEERIEGCLRDALGYEVTTFLRTPLELGSICLLEPFTAEELEAERAALYIGCLKTAPTHEAAQRIVALSTASDDLRIHGRELYWLCRTRFSESPITGARLERALGMQTTLRNVNTILRLADASL